VRTKKPSQEPANVATTAALDGARGTLGVAPASRGVGLRTVVTSLVVMAAGAA
jgi:hypothetical protein